MESFYRLPTIKTDEDALAFFKRAIDYRDNHKNEYGKIACFVFDSTHEIATSVKLSSDIDSIRWEFIALEGPGMPPDDETEPDEYDDMLWRRLKLIIDEAIKKRTV